MNNDNKPVQVPGKALRVTLYEDRAEVTRRARVGVSQGAQWIAVGGVTPFVDDRSVQAKVAAQGVRVLAARVRRRVTQVAEAGREEIDRLEADERKARQAIEAGSLAAQRVDAQKSRVTELLSEWCRALAQVPQAAHADAIAGWKSAYGSLSSATSAATLAEVAAGQSQEDLGESLARARARLAQACSTRTRCEASVEVQLEAQAAGEVDLDVTYRTPCALWRPEHLARLSTDGDEATKGKLEIVTWATVWQITGEEWKDVEATFSTARPARAAVPPLLTADLLGTRRKTEEEKKTIQVEAREQTIATTGVAGGKRAVDEMPGVDDGGLPLSFSTTSPVTLPSDGRPFRVEIGRISLDAAVARILMPERSQVSHYRALATHAGPAPLLAGPIRVARGAGLVGRTRLDFVAPGEPFELGFGPDDALRARRTLEVKRDTTAITGTQKIERTVKLFLSNLSDAQKHVELTERIPVSEHESVEIELKDSKDFVPEKTAGPATGMLKANLTIAPGATRTLALKYEIRAKSNVRLPF